MRSKLAISALVVASLFGATAIASAQSEPAQPAPGATGQGKNGFHNGTRPNEIEQYEVRHDHWSGPPGMTPGSVDESKPGGQSTARKPRGTRVQDPDCETRLLGAGLLHQSLFRSDLNRNGSSI
jgi:hypothetical protein